MRPLRGSLSRRPYQERLEIIGKTQKIFRAGNGSKHDADPLPFEILIKGIKEVGYRNCSLASDLGQLGNPLPAEGFKLFISRLLIHGLRPEEIRTMVRENPQRFLVP